MEKVGVDMDEVKEYAYMNTFLYQYKREHEDMAIIVKDEYAKEDLKQAIKGKVDLANQKIYTVKSVKGLEFKEVVVFDRDMTSIEKYIAYTRALSMLSVVKDLPEYFKKESKIEQGDDIVEEI